MGAQQLDQAQILNAAMEKKAKQFDRIVAEWKAKVDGLVMDLDVTQKETRNASSELFKVKSAYDESILQLEEVRRENKMLSNEIKDIMDQISEGGRSIHEIDKIRKRLEAEKLELQSSSSADCSSNFSASRRFLILSISWMERPPSLIWSMMSLISLERVLFSLRTSSSWRTLSS